MMEQGDKKVVVTFPRWNPGWVEPEVLRARVLDLLRVYRKMNLGVSPITGSFGWRREDGAVEVAFSAHSPLEGGIRLPEELCLGLAGHAVFWRNQPPAGASQNCVLHTDRREVHDEVELCDTDGAAKSSSTL
ncbi:hypothetical protein BHE90_017587 [Fusarium euwallaceae]|uniref:Uncharacterized protein n=1 Tax=Fusarium euwallaceae TaxID=1147111 RepID=A0A430KX53_9HYPO|nr:hypothetical protein BHE90_017587 [Fusarium euwallaceae]